MEFHTCEMKFTTLVFFFFSNSCGCLQLCITDTSSVNISCSLMLRRCYNWLWLNELFLSQQIEEFRSFYLCGRKVVDLQFQTADGRLAENDGFITAFHLNRQRHKVSSEIQFRKSPLFTLKCQFIMQTYLKLKQSNKTTLQIILPSWRLTSSILV